MPRETAARLVRIVQDMARKVLTLGGALASLVLVFVAIRSRPSHAEAAPPPREGSGTPVLVELFTSEGCSSCPPADAIFRAPPQVPGARLVLLAEHVDYWNDLGWPDPFSSASASSRQRGYASLGGGTYTPQAVVDGRTQVLGSHVPSLEKAIAAAAARPHARVDLSVAVAPPARGVFDVDAKVDALPGEDAELVVAIVQDRAHVDVRRGENAGRTLEHVAIARSLHKVAVIPRSGGSARTTVHLPAAIEAPDGTSFSVVAIVQEQASRRVLGSAAARLTPTR